MSGEIGGHPVNAAYPLSGYTLVFRRTTSRGRGEWVAEPAGSLGSVAWGSITGSISAQGDLVAFFATKENVGVAAALVAAHEAAADPHPQYLRQVEADVLYDPAGAAALAVLTHEAALDPHPQYLTQAEGDALYSPVGGPSSSGAQGTPGQDGADGLDGQPGQPGDRGATGADGARGLDGADGQDGRDGADGKDGTPGAKGDTGATGDEGSPGQDGSAGRDGRDGVDGAPGRDGLDGIDGADGRDGKDGRDGRDGIDGRDGQDGDPGSPGEKGDTGAPGGGGGGLTFTTIEQDLGATPQYNGSFDITGLSGLTAAKQVLVTQAAAVYTGKGTGGTVADEAEMAPVSATGYVVSTTVIRVYWVGTAGPVSGNVKFNYAVSG